MKSISLPTRLHIKSLPLAIMMTSAVFSQHAFAEQDRTLPVTELENIQFAQEVNIDDLSKVTIQHSRTISQENNSQKFGKKMADSDQGAINNANINQMNIKQVNANRNNHNNYYNESKNEPKAKSFASQKANELARREAELAKREAELKAAEEAVARFKAQQAKEQAEKEAKRREEEAKRVMNPPMVTTPTPPPIAPQPSTPKAKPTPTTGAVTGEVVAGKTADTSNDEVIKNIESKNGKNYTRLSLNSYAQKVNSAVWTPNMRKNSAMTVKLQALLDWNHASPGPIDGGWGMNSVKALTNFQAMKGLPTTGKMDEATWRALNKNIDPNQPVLMGYKIRPSDTKYFYTQIPRGYPAKSKLKALNYQNIYEKIAEEYHMNVNYLKKLNTGKRFVAGETIAVYNPGPALNSRITKVVANKADRTLYAYNGKRLVATYPTTVGSAATPSPHGKFKIVSRVKKPHYRATVEKEGEKKQVYMLKPGPNSPVGIVWMGLSKPSYGIHGSPIPEGISRQASHGCIRLTNWDALEVRHNIRTGATVILE